VIASRLNQTDADWEQLALLDPYWAVLTQDEFRRANFGTESRAAFFASGEHNIRETFQTIRTHLDPTFAPRRALDFGCGVGRLILPLAKRCASVVGVDVSDSMLQEAASNCRAIGASNVELVKGDDNLSAIRGQFDLVHTLIVLQHIPIVRGEQIFRRLVELVSPGGCGAIHITYRRSASQQTRQPANRSRFGVLARAVLRPLRRLVRKRVAASSTPGMQMNTYELNTLFATLQEARVQQVVVTFTDHNGCYGVQLFFRKLPAPAEVTSDR
jgi:2-polyprenyl-3-methyl-5-hydroxy-6-metoxy-1,4-benzoquinol methylase